MISYDYIFYKNNMDDLVTHSYAFDNIDLSSIDYDLSLSLSLYIYIYMFHITAPCLVFIQQYENRNIHEHYLYFANFIYRYCTLVTDLLRGLKFIEHGCGLTAVNYNPPTQGIAIGDARSLKWGGMKKSGTGSVRYILRRHTHKMILKYLDDNICIVF